ncbi:MAG: porin [Pseudomonadota bacterium]
MRPTGRHRRFSPTRCSLTRAVAYCALLGAALADAAAADPVEVDVSGEASAVLGVSEGELNGDLDAEVRVDASTVFENGVEVGAVVEGRLDGQQPDQMFAGGRYSGFLIGGPRGVAPMRSDAYLQSAFAYARGGFGEVSVGRSEGVSRTLAVTAPTLFRAFNVNDWRSDLSGLNDVHTVNDFTGFATKVTYLPPANVFGGALGGLRLGMSYSPQLASCGPNRCAPVDRLLLAPDASPLDEDANWADAFEGAFYYQQEFRVSARDGLLFGLGGSYVTADAEGEPMTTSPNFGDYEAVSLGLNLAYRGITIGGSFKSSNGGIATDDEGYLAFDAGVTYRSGEDAGDWGIMFGYGRSEADFIGPSLVAPTVFQDTQTAQAGLTYFVAPGITIGAAAQFVEASRPESAGGDEEATTVVLESSIKF